MVSLRPVDGPSWKGTRGGNRTEKDRADWDTEWKKEKADEEEMEKRGRGGRGGTSSSLQCAGPGWRRLGNARLHPPS